MWNRLVRQSKFRHTFGQPLKREQCHEDIRITKSSWDGTFCAVNTRYIAIVSEAAASSSFYVLDINKPGRVDRDQPMVSGHTGAVLDIAWCPFHDEVIASASDDTTVKIWQIPEGGLRRDLTEPIVELLGHQKRVSMIVWHPTANNVLVSVGWDNKLLIWNCGTTECLVEIDLPDYAFSAAWNFNGSRLAVSCKDKSLRVLDARSGDVLSEGRCHEGAKPAQVVYLRDHRVFTTGFSKMSERQYALWDENDLSKPITMQEIDSSNGVMFPFYDPDNSLIYLVGKGDTTIRYFEISDEDPYVHYLEMFKSTEPQRGIGFMPKRGLNVNACEIARFYKLHARGYCEAIPMIVPRKSELFQDDLYPDTAGDVPALSADEWLEGKDADPILVSLKSGYVATKKVQARKQNKPKSTILNRMPVKSQAAADHTNGAQEPPPQQQQQPAASAAKADEPRSAPTVPKAEPTPEPVAPAPKPVSTTAKDRTASHSAEPKQTSASGTAVAAKTGASTALPDNKLKELEADAHVCHTHTTDTTTISSSTDRSEELAEVVEAVKTLRETVKRHEQRIAELESQLANLATASEDDSPEETVPNGNDAAAAAPEPVDDKDDSAAV